MKYRDPKSAGKPRRPLDDEALGRLGLFYVGRYATTRAKLQNYLQRKVQERGWTGDTPPDVPALVERLSTLGYVDDAAFASARASSLQRRGYGERRIAEALRAAGVETEEAEAVKEQGRDGAYEAALRFAKRKRIGPFGDPNADRAARTKAFAAMMRAGHPIDLVREVLNLTPGEEPL